QAMISNGWRSFAGKAGLANSAMMRNAESAQAIVGAPSANALSASTTAAGRARRIGAGVTGLARNGPGALQVGPPPGTNAPPRPAMRIVRASAGAIASSRMLVSLIIG